MKLFIDRIQQNLSVAKNDSDFSYFFGLLVAGEALTKLITLVSVCALDSEKDRHQYRILHGLVRANGIGDWSKALNDALLGTASQHLNAEFRNYQAEITKKTEENEWQSQAVCQIENALKTFDENFRTTNAKKVSLQSWFKLFTELRNRTRGHGMMSSTKASAAAVHLEKSVALILENLSLFDIPTAYLKRNLSGKYRVTRITGETESLERYRSTTDASTPDGVYIDFDKPRIVPLLISDPEASDFHMANGGFTHRKYELISYLTDDKKYGDSSEYMAPLGVLPGSESEGLGELNCVGNCFSNVPSLSYDYIERDELEDQLYDLLLDERRPVITLLGRGGIGKTSLALKVLPRLYEESRYDAVVWFSSRDIDLQASGPKLVTADVVSNSDISKYYCKLVLSNTDIKKKDFLPIQYFQSQLTESDIGSTLFVFDNFETTSSPVEVFRWIDTYIRLPNKVLITTRLREFVGDYPITVRGMTNPESENLIELTAKQLGIEDKIPASLKENIIKVSAGHPYIIKIMLGELSKNGMKGSLPKIIAGSDEVLTALFERTYSALNPCSKRVFLTLSAWNSAVPRLALESVLMGSIDDTLEVEKSIETLIQYSLIEEFKSEIDEQYFILMPLTAMSFGEKKLRVSPLKGTIKSDVRMLQMFGPTKTERKTVSFLPHVRTFLSNLENSTQAYHSNKELLERIGLSYARSLPLVSRWLAESGDHSLLSEAKQGLYLYLERETSEELKSQAWAQLASVCRELKEPLNEVHALVESSQNSKVDFSELSNVINRVNHMLGTQQLVLENHDEKNELLTTIYETVKRRKNEGDAVDFSRMAWLALHLDKKEEAKELAEHGLRIDPYNQYCQGLTSKLGHVAP